MRALKNNIGHQFLTVVSQVKDLGRMFSNNLSFVNHTHMISYKAIRTLGFIKRKCLEFDDPTCHIVSYTALVRSQLEYGSIMWDSYQIGLVEKLELILKRFIRVL